MDRLASEGVILENNYVQPMCTPSRAAMLTGMYPYHIGRQVKEKGTDIYCNFFRTHCCFTVIINV